MQKGQHIGKVVISFPPEETRALVPTQMPTKMPSFRPEAAYLLVGGMGGLGQAVGTWLVSHGARHLVFFSRSAGMKKQDCEYIKELEAQGCTVDIHKGSVAERADVQRVLRSVEKPIAGVMQVSMVLKVSPVEEQHPNFYTADTLCSGLRTFGDGV